MDILAVYKAAHEVYTSTEETEKHTDIVFRDRRVAIDETEDRIAYSTHTQHRTRIKIPKIKHIRREEDNGNDNETRIQKGKTKIKKDSSKE